MRAITTATIIGLIALPALAGGASEPIPTGEPVVRYAAFGSDWTGGYVGGNLGYSWADADSGSDGWLGGIFGGYQSDFGAWVIGGEASYDWTDIGSNGANIDAISRLKLRAGYDLGTMLLYGVGGASYADVRLRNRSASDWGWVIGAGADFRISNSMTLGTELLYDSISDFDDRGVDLDATTLAMRLSLLF